MSGLGNSRLVRQRLFVTKSLIRRAVLWFLSVRNVSRLLLFWVVEKKQIASNKNQPQQNDSSSAMGYTSKYPTLNSAKLKSTR